MMTIKKRTHHRNTFLDALSKGYASSGELWVRSKGQKIFKNM